MTNTDVINTHYVPLKNTSRHLSFNRVVSHYNLTETPSFGKKKYLLMCRKINKCTKEQRRSLNVERLIKYIGLTRIYYFVCRKNLIGHCEEIICLLVETWSVQSNESWKFFFMIESNFWKMEYHKIFDFWKKKTLSCKTAIPASTWYTSSLSSSSLRYVSFKVRDIWRISLTLSYRYKD